MKRGKEALVELLVKKQKRHKYNVSTKAERTADCIVFDSKAEMRRYLDLKLLMSPSSGTTTFVRFFLRQVPFHLAGGVTYRCDFAVFYNDGRVEFEDVKGVKTPMYRLKKKQVEQLYPVKILEIEP